MTPAKKTIASVAVPGVSFTVRRLNLIQRARRDAGIAEQRLEYTRLLGELQALRKRNLAAPDEEGRLSQLEALSPAIKHQMVSLDERARLLLECEIVPATIAAVLVELRDERQLPDPSERITLDSVYSIAPDDLIAELRDAAEEMSGLTADQQKN